MGVQPKSVKINDAQAVQLAQLETANGRIVSFQSKAPGQKLTDWAQQNHKWVDEVFDRHGAILFRGFAVDDDAFYRFARQFSRELMDYSEPSTPRTKLADKIYTSTEYPSEQVIPMHNEHSYSNHWPQRIWFNCSVPAARGGQSPLCDSRKVYEKISPAVREQFARKGVMYVRNFGKELDLPWQQVFGSEEKAAVEAHCRKAGIAFEWKENDNLRTRQVCQAVLPHPRTGEMLWFNQAHLFHLTNLDPDVRQFLMDRYGEANLPRNTYYGDGSPIPDAVLAEIREAYRQTQLVFDWQASDVVMLDNMLYAHGRNPFEGKRRVLVAMADPYTSHWQPAKPAAGDPPEGQQAVVKARKQTAQHFIRNHAAAQSPEEIKYRLAASYRIMVAEGLDEGGISGHITARVPGQPDRFWVNPFGLLAEEVTPQNLIMVDHSGNVLEGDYPVNVAGFCIHAAIHQARPDVHCVVHTHSPWGTLFSSLDKYIEPIDQNCCIFFEDHALYTQYNGPVNDPEDALQLAKTLGDKQAIILANHGTITCGDSIESAAMRMVAIERAFRLNILAMQTGTLKLVSPEIARLTREWVGNPMGFAIEFNALLRKAERLYPDLKAGKPGGASAH